MGLNNLKITSNYFHCIAMFLFQLVLNALWKIKDFDEYKKVKVNK